jgi:ubiquinone/menaquinone biosynthesis C-methylase UbiE
MKMTALEKVLVNRPAKATRTASALGRALGRAFARISGEGIDDVLEIGCGTGAAAAHLHEQYDFDALGVDVDPKQIELARVRQRESDRLRFAVGDATSLALGDHSFDMVVAQNTFHHISRWDLALKEVSRVLRPGGLLVWQDFAVREWARPLARPLRNSIGVYTLAEVRRKLAHYGVHQRVHERARLGLLDRHHLIMQKLSTHGTLPALA